MVGGGRARRVLFVDDDDAVLRSISLLLGSRYELSFAATGAEARAVAEAPHVAFVDLGLPDVDGVTLVRELALRWQDTPLVVLTVHRTDERVLAAFRAGAQGYVLKEDVGDKLPRAIDEAFEGGAPMSASIARRVLRLLAGLPERAAPNDETLTVRELDVVHALANGQTYEQVASTLGMSVNTLRSHVRNVYRKLSVGSRTEAVLAAIQLGLLNRR